MRLPRLNGREVIRALTRLGFREVRVKGSHHYLVHQTDPTRRATVPVHGNRALHPSIVVSILRTTQTTRDQLADAL